MIRKSYGKDISEEEWDNVLNPFYDNYTDFMESYVMPEVIAFYIASSFIETLCGNLLLKNTIILERNT